MSAERAPVSPRRAALGFALLVALVLGMLVALRWTPLGEVAQRERLVELLDQLRDNPWAPLIFCGLYLVLTPLGLPTSPLLASGAVVFGVFWGSVYNYLGSLLGAMSSYFLARGLGRDFVLHLVGRRMARLDDLLDRHGFWALTRLRLLPLPFPLMNFGPALVGVKAPTFFFSTALGLVVPLPLWTYFWATLFGAAAGSSSRATAKVLLALALVLLLSFAPRLWLALRRRHRQPPEGGGP